MGSRHCSYKGPPLAPHSRPSEATVKRLAAEAEMQQKMWDLFVPEGGIRFGDRRFWVLLSIVLGLHAANMYKDSRKPRDLGLPEGAVRRLPDGGLLLADGSIAKNAEAAPAAQHTLHRVREAGEDDTALGSALRKMKDAV
ncbi:hypothetical protein EMIHUDRAFT_449706 [Emiliania huxleyi CCMP1516]|uniref:Uncharacterized protein n=3 Tax=Emiliania huxleyi TaxID=2903 RepID=A0A0D3J4I1_EMIH1|nr:hypothetical protein EMIHUDRAFT_432412 [Emiliania huxleyi CCMP1516]XP_005783628.1 hypothetical protein EMIHUDRAFT_449706 [Emiliania huxleyi CCMP1516]EOD18416.1 hypothetical protein EMIHUDRAFT_432412 [Emiliania huxleyi CCMP1516]EOD31199.1 hypothetical protein EMIHUDRAFT_449706 [Emiliania huxleyi CCMP1516]|eukprot:XP_005770845.1 hypothetical protein EMIHUDRAFT_432412 [Emiliania huxleyi CCMP1516]